MTTPGCVQKWIAQLAAAPVTGANASVRPLAAFKIGAASGKREKADFAEVGLRKQHRSQCRPTAQDRGQYLRQFALLKRLLKEGDPPVFLP
jgi:hypothetical protein